MKSHPIATSLFAGTLTLMTGFAFAEIDNDIKDKVTTKKVVKQYETQNGNTVTVRKIGQTDHQGNARGARQYRIVNDQGETVGRGHSRARKNADGWSRKSTKRWVDANGNRHAKKRIRKSQS